MYYTKLTPKKRKLSGGQLGAAEAALRRRLAPLRACGRRSRLAAKGTPLGADRGARGGGTQLPGATRKTYNSTGIPKPPACPAQGARKTYNNTGIPKPPACPAQGARKTYNSTGTPKPPACPAQGARHTQHFTRLDISPARPLYPALYLHVLQYTQSELLNGQLAHGY